MNRVILAVGEVKWMGGRKMCSICSGPEEIQLLPPSRAAAAMTWMSEGDIWIVTGNIQSLWFPTLPSHAPHTLPSFSHRAINKPLLPQADRAAMKKCSGMNTI